MTNTTHPPKNFSPKHINNPFAVYLYYNVIFLSNSLAKLHSQLLRKMMKRFATCKKEYMQCQLNGFKTTEIIFALCKVVFL